MFPQDAVFGLVERAVPPIEVVRDKSRFETRIEGRGVECREAALAGSGDADSLRIDARDFAEEVYRRRDLLDLTADQVAADLVGEADEPAAVFGPRLAEYPALGEEGDQNHVSVDSQAAGILFPLWQPGGEADDVGGREVSIRNCDHGGVLAGPLGLEQKTVLFHQRAR